MKNSQLINYDRTCAMELCTRTDEAELYPLIPAKAGIQMEALRVNNLALGPRFRGDERKNVYPSPPLLRLPSAACAAASRAIGTRNGEHDT